MGMAQTSSSQRKCKSYKYYLKTTKNEMKKLHLYRQGRQQTIIPFLAIVLPVDYRIHFLDTPENL